MEAPKLSASQIQLGIPDQAHSCLHETILIGQRLAGYFYDVEPHSEPLAITKKFREINIIIKK